ncbi:MAG TPA: hypothetical protein VG722_12975 [Tepidisphaeraceae bacterium]|nr:hypothetical protein [Tepidisphaeraceae bacterium]
MTRVAKIFRRLRSHPFAATFLLYQFIFFNIFLPVHTRGIVTVEGKYTGACPACCCEQHSPKQLPTHRDPNDCEFCHFAARVVPPQIFSIVLPDLGLLELLPVPTPAVACSVHVLSTHPSRGPPSLA